RDTAPGCARRTTQRPHRRRDAARHGQGGGRQPWRRWSICRTNTALGSTTCRITSKDRDWLTSFRPSLSSISRSCRRSIRHAATAATESGGKNRLTSKAPYKPAPAKAGVIDGEEGVVLFAEADLRPVQLLLDETVAVEVVGGLKRE